MAVFGSSADVMVVSGTMFFCQIFQGDGFIAEHDQQREMMLSLSAGPLLLNRLD
jgi:hypothetical protein